MAADRWNIQIATEDTFSAPLYDETVFVQSFQPASDLAANTMHYWRVRAGDGVDWSDWSAVWVFETQAGDQTITLWDGGSGIDTIAPALPSPISIPDAAHGIAAIHELFAALTLPDLASGGDAIGVADGSDAITLHADADRENWDLPNCIVTGHSVHLVVRRQFNAYNPGIALWYNTLGRVSRVLGKTPQFALAMGGNISSTLTLDAIHPMWSRDGENWSYFDIRDYDPISMLAEFSHSQPFPVDTIHVCLSPPVRVGDCTAWVQALAAEYPQWVHQPPSALAYNQGPFVVAHSVAQTDDSGRNIPPLPIHGLRIAADDQQPDGERRTLVWCSGVHAGEDYGDWSLRGAVEFALSSDPVAVRLRRNYQIFVYPLVTPCGRYGGDYRGNWEFGAGQVSPDPNRDWHDSPLTHIRRLVAAILMDTGGTPNIHGYFDFHGMPNSGTHAYFSDPRGHAAEFLAAVSQFLPQGVTNASTGSHPRASQAFFSHYLNSYFSMTGEPNQFRGPALDVAKVKQIGAAAAKSFDFIYPQIYTAHEPLLMEAGKAHAYPLPQGQPSGWQYSCPISVNPDAIVEQIADAYVVITQASVPPQFWEAVRADGADIRITLAGATLSRWLEHLDAQAQTLRLWVRVPTLPTSGAELLLMFGNPQAAETQATDFWDVACYTMADGAAGTLTDASGNGYHAALTQAQSEVPGVLGSATRWDTNAGGPTGVFPDSSFKTLFGFFKFPTLPAGQQLCGANDGSNHRFFIGRNGSKINSGWGNSSVSGAIDLTPDQWHLLAFSVDGVGSVQRSVDGVADSASLGGFTGTSAHDFHHGRISNGAVSLVGASVDHLVVSKIYRTRAWLRLLYLCAMQPETALSMGEVTEDQAPGPRWIQTVDSGTGAEASAADAATLIADLVEAVDGPDVVVGIALADAGAGADGAPGSAAQLQLAEVASGADTVAQLLAALRLQDAGAAAEIPGIGLMLGVTDAGEASEVLALFTEALRMVADTAAGGEILAVSVAPVVLTDAAAGADQPILAVQATVTDSGSGFDSLALSLLRQVIDQAFGLDHVVDIEFAIIINVVDAGAGVDLLGPVSAIAAVLEQVRGIDATIVAGNDPPRNATIIFRGRTGGVSFTGRQAAMTFRRGD